MIEVEGLSKSYGTVEALRGISFSVKRGEIVGLLGPNGAGKTTTMKILTGYLQPTDGTARIGGTDVLDDPLRVQAQVGYLPENAPIYLDMAVQEYLMLAADLREIPQPDRKALLSDAIHSTGIESYLTRPIGSLSKGYRQRVGLAQAILHRPSVLILDEPTNGLDPTQILEVRSLIKRLSESATVIVSTHHLAEVEAVCHRAIVIMNGRIRADARLAELTASAAATAAISGDAAEVTTALQAIPGVTAVSSVGAPSGGFQRYRVTGGSDVDLCPAIFDVVRTLGLRLCELRPETRTLETVFRELAIEEGVAA